MKRIGFGLLSAILLMAMFSLGVYSQTDEAGEAILARVQPLLVDLQQQVPISVTLVIPEGATEGQTVTVPLMLDMNLQIGIVDTGEAVIEVGSDSQSVIELSESRDASTASSALVDDEIQVEEQGVALTVVDATLQDRFQGTAGTETAGAGSRFLVMEVLLENLDAAQLDYYSHQFTVKDADGYEYPAEWDAPQSRLQGGDLPPQDRVRGFVAFKVPDTKRLFTLTFSSSYLEPIRVGLGEVEVTETEPVRESPSAEAVDPIPEEWVSSLLTLKDVPTGFSLSSSGVGPANENLAAYYSTELDLFDSYLDAIKYLDELDRQRGYTVEYIREVLFEPTYIHNGVRGYGSEELADRFLDLWPEVVQARVDKGLIESARKFAIPDIGEASIALVTVWISPEDPDTSFTYHEIHFRVGSRLYSVEVGALTGFSDVDMVVDLARTIERKIQ